MKNWSAPEVSELNINETANGCLNACVEFWFLNDNKKSTPDPVVDEPST